MTPARHQNRPDSAGGRRRRERGAGVTGLRSEAGGLHTILPPAPLIVYLFVALKSLESY